MFGFGQNKKITEKLYEQNLELAVINKRLSLLEKLYQTSVLTLMPQDMASKITDIVRQDLNLELASIFTFNKEIDSLIPLSFSKSERLAKTISSSTAPFTGITIPNISKSEFLKKVVYNREDGETGDLKQIWDGSINQDQLELIKKESHIKTLLSYPLIIGTEVSSILLLGLNRDYETLNTFERASIKSFINVIALLLDKAYLYKGLQDSYEVTKKAYAVEKRANEELQKLDRVKNDFLLTTQHDLRRPLTSVKWFLDMLVQGILGKQNKKTLEGAQKVQVSVEDSIEEVNDFLDMAQFQMGKGGVVTKPGVDILAILERIITKLKPKAEVDGVALTFEKPEKAFTIDADPVKMKAAISNVIDNSVKYSPKGKVEVKVSDGKTSGTILIAVKDNGIGIPADKIKSIFESMFERTEDAKRTTTMGKGIGLPLSTQIIKSHNGKIWAESEGEGKGSNFFIELPIKQPVTAVPTPPTPPPPEK